MVAIATSLPAASFTVRPSSACVISFAVISALISFHVALYVTFVLGNALIVVPAYIVVSPGSSHATKMFSAFVNIFGGRTSDSPELCVSVFVWLPPSENVTVTEQLLFSTWRRAHYPV